MMENVCKTLVLHMAKTDHLVFLMEGHSDSREIMMWGVKIFLYSKFEISWVLVLITKENDSVCFSWTTSEFKKSSAFFAHGTESLRHFPAKRSVKGQLPADHLIMSPRQPAFFFFLQSTILKSNLMFGGGFYF
jgi:hypothetical protein